MTERTPLELVADSLHFTRRMTPEKAARAALAALHADGWLIVREEEERTKEVDGRHWAETMERLKEPGVVVIRIPGPAMEDEQ